MSHAAGRCKGGSPRRFSGASGGYTKRGSLHESPRKYRTSCCATSAGDPFQTLVET